MAEENLNATKGVLKENIKQVVEELFSEKEAVLMRTIELQTLYRLGRVEQENIFLKEEIETLLKEKEKLKTFPATGDNISLELSQKEEIISKLEKEKSQLSETTSRLEGEKKNLEEQIKLLPAEPEKINATLLQNAENMLLLKFQNEEIIKKFQEMEDLLKSEEEMNKKLQETLKSEEEKSKSKDREIEELKLKLEEEQK